MKTGIAITAFGILALLGLWMFAAEEQAKPTERSALQREVETAKSGIDGGERGPGGRKTGSNFA